MNYTTVAEIFSYGLHEFLDRLQLDLIEVGHEINNTFFSPQISGKNP